MKSKTFELEVKQGQLIIPSDLQDYLNHCSESVKISLTIQSISEQESQLANYWDLWLEEVEKLDPISANSAMDDYQKLLTKKYKEQGIEL